MHHEQKLKNKSFQYAVRSSARLVSPQILVVLGLSTLFGERECTIASSGCLCFFTTGCSSGEVLSLASPLANFQLPTTSYCTTVHNTTCCMGKMVAGLRPRLRCCVL
jgi:hypothetical protein